MRLAIVYDQRVEFGAGRCGGTRRDRPGGDRAIPPDPELPEHVEETALVAAGWVGIVVLDVIEPDDHLAAARAVAQRCSLPRIVGSDDLPVIIGGPAVRPNGRRFETERLADALLELIVVHVAVRKSSRE